MDLFPRTPFIAGMIACLGFPGVKKPQCNKIDATSTARTPPKYRQGVPMPYILAILPNISLDRKILML